MTKLDEKLVKQAPKDLQEILKKSKAETNEEAKNIKLFGEVNFLTSVLTTSSGILNICGDFTGNSPKGMLRLTALKLLPSMRGSPTKLRSAMIWDFMSGMRMTKTS